MTKNGRIELADIFRTHGAQYLATHKLAPAQAKAWRAIVACRTEALGGHIEQCNACETKRYIYHSCRNRHCPKCQMRATERWVAQRHRELLPVPYVHLVFTIPHSLNNLAWHHFRLMTDILFASVSSTLIEFGADPRWLGGDLAFSLVLHTWTQTLLRHLHLHALVANGALSKGGQWINGKQDYLFPAEALSAVFRGKFITALQAAKDAGQFKERGNLTDDSWKRLLIALRKHDWVVYAKAPLGGPEQVIDYLSRYTHRVAISNERLLSCKDGQVRLRVRDNTTPGKKRVESLAAENFIGRFLQHVLPTGFKRIRHYGILASAHKAAKLAQCREALDMPIPDEVAVESVEAFMLRVTQVEINACTCCANGRFHVVGVIVPKRLPVGYPTGPPSS